MKKSVLFFGIFAVLTPVIASAEGGYLGASYGQVEYKLSSAEIAGLNAMGRTVLDDSDQAFKVFGGYRYNKNIAVEVSYANLGDLEVSDVSLGGVRSETSGYSLSAVGLLPVTEQIDLFAKAGAFIWSVDGYSNAARMRGNDGSDMTYGIGAAYTFGVTTLRAEVERFEIGSSNLDMVSAGLSLNF
jgi:hypothetical protein